MGIFGVLYLLAVFICVVDHVSCLFLLCCLCVCFVVVFRACACVCVVFVLFVFRASIVVCWVVCVYLCSFCCGCYFRGFDRCVDVLFSCLYCLLLFFVLLKCLVI